MAKLSLDNSSVKEQIIQAKKELFNLRFQKVQSSLTNTARIRYLRRNIARLKTFLNIKND
jgi:large subunit ribosomal protein L29